jgi:hypothetical protein
MASIAKPSTGAPGIQRKSYYGDYKYGQRELQKIFVFLDKNGYTFKNVETSDTEGVMNAIFSKDIKYSDKDGNGIGDRDINVTVSIDSDFDWKHQYRDDDGEFEFSADNLTKGEDFVEKLSKNNYSKKAHGGKKNKTRRS